jgi:magnesium transporter
MSRPDDLEQILDTARRAQAAGDLDALIDSVEIAVESGDLDTVAVVLAALRPADRVDVFEKLDLHQQRLMIGEITEDEAAEILEELGDDDAAEVAGALPPEDLAPILDAMNPDDAADVLGDLTLAQAESALDAMDDAAEADARSLMVFSDDSAGGLMTLDFVSLKADDTEAESLERLRRMAPDADTAFYLYVTDAVGRLAGVVSLRQLVVAQVDARIADLMDTNVIKVEADEDQEDAARLMARYDLLALPVVDSGDRLIGVITHDDLVDVLEEEATEDMYRLVGLDEEERTADPVRVSVRRRLPWLALNLGMALILVWALQSFEGAFAAVPVLAVLFPLVTGQGGNVGTQTMTFVVRSMALGEIAGGNQRRLLLKELAIGLVNGLVIGAMAAIIALVVASDTGLALRIAFAIAVAMTLNLAAGGLIGVVVPLAVRRLGYDPAIASSVFVTTATDTLGVLFFLGLSYIVLGLA